MVRTTSAAKRAQDLSRKKELAYKDAVAIYEEEHHAHAASGPNARKPRSLRDLVLHSNGFITATTLSRCLKGLPSARDVAVTKLAKLRLDEEERLVSHVLTQGRLGFPYTHKVLSEVANSILQKRHERDGTTFRPVGKHWSFNFVRRHDNELGMYWSKSLQNVRAESATPEVLDGWMDLVERVQQGDFSDGEPILTPEHCKF